MRLTRNKKAGHKWTWAKELTRFRTKGERRIGNPILPESWIDNMPDDTHPYPDDLTVKADGAKKFILKSIHLDERRKSTKYT